MLLFFQSLPWKHVLILSLLIAGELDLASHNILNTQILLCMDEIYMHEELTKMPLAKRDVLLQNPNISNKECFAFLLEIYLQYFSNSL